MKSDKEKTKDELIREIEELRKRVASLEGSGDVEISLRAQLLDNASDAICLFNPDGEYVYVNDIYCTFHGRTREELIGTNIRNMDANATDEWLVWLESELSKKGSVVFETTHYRKDGSAIELEVHSTEMEVGGIRYNLSLERDITERKEAEVLFQSIAENSPVGVYIVQKSKFVYTNPQFQKDTGYTEEELLGMKSINLVLSEDRETVRENTIRMLKGLRKTPYEFRTVNKNGETRWALETVASISYRGERATIGSYQDITEQKKIQENLLVTDRLASVGELAAGIAHELNNPLTGVIGFSDLLLERDDIPVDIRGDLEIINRESVRASQVARHLLTFARKHPDEKAPVDINQIIRTVLDLRAYEHKVNNITVEAQYDPDLPEVMGNDFQLQQVILNLVINAEYFMIEEYGKGTLWIVTEHYGDVVRVSISDSGPGILPEQLTRLFDPFYTTKEVGKGTGLGLSICYGVVTEYGGKIWAESEPGEGATFVIEMPAYKQG